VDGRPGEIDEHGTRRSGSLSADMSTIQDIDREAARRVARVLGESEDAGARGWDEGTGDTERPEQEGHAAGAARPRTPTESVWSAARRIRRYVPRILALAAAVAAIAGLLQIAGNSGHGWTWTGSLEKPGRVDPAHPQGTAVMNNTIQRQVLAAAVTAAVGATANAQQAVQWRVDDGGNGHWYARIVRDSRNWTAMKAAAKGVGGHLATVTSSDESAFLVNHVLAGNFCFIGGFQPPSAPEPATDWRWVTGEPLVWSNWASGEPNNYPPSSDEDCMAIWGGGQWADVNEDAYLTPCNHAIIEWSADCNNDGIVDYGQILSGELVDADTNGVPDTCECPCDVFPDNAVNGIDLGVLLGQWGEVTQYTVTDFNRDGAVDGSDLGQLLAAWGPCPS
jgi:hypothetical protein